MKKLGLRHAPVAPHLGLIRIQRVGRIPRGLLTRERSSRDRRVVELHLTRVGRRTIEKLLPRVVGELNAALAPLSRDEFEQFQGFLLRILDHLQPESPPVVEEPPARATRR